MRFMTTLTATLASTVTISIVAAPAVAQDVDTCDTVTRYVNRGDYPKALEELTWCQRAIQELHYAKISELLEQEAGGFSPGEASYDAAMGLSAVTIEYARGDAYVKLIVTSGSGGASAASTGLGALAGLASAFGVSSSDTKQVRVAGLTGSLEQKGDDQVELILTMDGGVILTWEAPDLDAIKAIADVIVPDLEDYLG